MTLGRIAEIREDVHDAVANASITAEERDATKEYLTLLDLAERELRRSRNPTCSTAYCNCIWKEQRIAELEALLATKKGQS